MHSTNLKFAVLSLSLLLCSCRTGDNQPTVSEKPTEVNPSQSLAPIADAPIPLGKAKATCGDALPKDEKVYPVSFHPVFVSYSEKNLEIVKKHFCADAIKRRSEKLGKDVVQVGSFTSKERANALKSELSAHLQGADIGEPTVIQTFGKVSVTKNVGEAARLSPQQINQLKEIVGVGKDFKTQDVVVLPTDIPNDFQAVKFSSIRQKHRSPKFTGGRYSIHYKNSKSECFELSGGVIQPIGDEPTKYEKVITLNSPALGAVDIGIVDGDRELYSGMIGFTESMQRIMRGRNEYRFVSQTNKNKDQSDSIYQCTRMAQEDAVRVARSMQFLNP
jgi:hypothetical protein